MHTHTHTHTHKYTYVHVHVHTCTCTTRNLTIKDLYPLSHFSRLGTWVSYSFCVGLFVLYRCSLLGLGFLPFSSSSTTTRVRAYVCIIIMLIWRDLYTCTMYIHVHVQGLLEAREERAHCVATISQMFRNVHVHVDTPELLIRQSLLVYMQNACSLKLLKQISSSKHVLLILYLIKSNHY